MKTLIIISISIGSVIAILISIYAFFGGFKKVEFNIIKNGGEILIYKDVVGDYKESGKVMDEVYYSLLNDYKIETYKGFGIYRDNPKKISKNELRSEIGCILEKDDSSKISILEKNFKVKILTDKKYITTSFPYKGSFSIFIGVLKVYPALNAFVEKNNYHEQGSVIEIYDRPNNTIFYRKEIATK